MSWNLTHTLTQYTCMHAWQIDLIILKCVPLDKNQIIIKIFPSAIKRKYCAINIQMQNVFFFMCEIHTHIDPSVVVVYFSHVLFLTCVTKLPVFFVIVIGHFSVDFRVKGKRWYHKCFKVYLINLYTSNRTHGLARTRTYKYIKGHFMKRMYRMIILLAVWS